MERPKIKIELSRTDVTLETIGVLGLMVTFLALILNYNDLPEIMPGHFNASGQPDGFGSKAILWALPGMALALYLLLTIVLRYPHAFNYPMEITAENAERQYRNAVMMVRILKTILVIVFSYLTYAVIQNGLGKMDGLGILFLPLSLTLVLGTVAVFIYRGYRLK